MDKIKEYVEQQIATLVPNYEKLEVTISVNDSSYSIGFFATVNGTRMQYMEMVDNGLIQESNLETVSGNIFKYIKSSENYRPGEINEFSFTLNK